MWKGEELEECKNRNKNRKLRKRQKQMMKREGKWKS